MRSMRKETWIKDEMAALRKDDRLRQLQVTPGTGPRIETPEGNLINFSSNDYLGLSQHPLVHQRASEAQANYGTGAGASRLVSGHLPLHEELENTLAALKGYPAALVFGSGFLANAGVIGTWCQRHDVVLADRLAHASLLDATRTTGARLMRFQHNDPGHLNHLLGRVPVHTRKLILTESVFSMDGDLAPLDELAAVAETHHATLLVDEAHATGVFGPHGAGRIHEQGLCERIPLCVGTLSKALGGYGGFATCSTVMREGLINRARAFIYSTALPPPSVGAALGALEALRHEPGLGPRALALAERLRARLHALGLDTGASASTIVPVVIGASAPTLAVAQYLRTHGVLAIAIRPPTVPEGTARIRLSVRSDHTEEEIDQAAQRVQEALDHIGELIK